ncbi:MAG: sigma-70 family RNA polymerase sigma factor [Anaerolineae bacterium]|nr:sigma-70 family RNA polymerase sigma factor [Anaerolineae bacterium]
MISQAPAPSAVSNSLHQLLPPTEASELIRRARQYDEKALTRIYTLFSDRVFRFIYYRIQDRSRAQDLTNEVFVRLLEGIERFQPSGDDPSLALAGWILTIARNIIIDDYRRNKVRSAVPLPEDIDELADSRNDLELHLTRADLQAALGQLTEEQQTVLLLRFEEGFTSGQIAKMMGKTDMAIKALQRRGLASMARLMGHGQDDAVRGRQI